MNNPQPEKIVFMPEVTVEEYMHIKPYTTVYTGIVHSSICYVVILLKCIAQFFSSNASVAKEASALVQVVQINQTDTATTEECPVKYHVFQNDLCCHININIGGTRIVAAKSVNPITD
jgi:hypothetical protein